MVVTDCLAVLLYLYCDHQLSCSYYVTGWVVRGSDKYFFACCWLSAFYVLDLGYFWYCWYGWSCFVLVIECCVCFCRVRAYCFAVLPVRVCLHVLSLSWTVNIEVIAGIARFVRLRASMLVRNVIVLLAFGLRLFVNGFIVLRVWRCPDLTGWWDNMACVMMRLMLSCVSSL